MSTLPDASIDVEPNGVACERGASARPSTPGTAPPSVTAANGSYAGIARHTLGVLLLLAVVVLWTLSNLFMSTILADKTFPKPFFVTYFNTAFFTLALFRFITRRLFGKRAANPESLRGDAPLNPDESRPFLGLQGNDITERDSLASARLSGDSLLEDGKPVAPEKLDLRTTSRLSLEFCLLWFFANYFAIACLENTTLGSATILTSTSVVLGVWTLVFGALLGVEKFTTRKLLGVVASLIGIVIISRVDLSGSSDKNRGSFPHKSPTELAVGNAMAALSAILYGVYTTVMKKQAGDENRISMPLFFGLVGLWNTILMWPGFLILHFTGLETFEWPDKGLIWSIILVNAATSLISDICWAYAMLLTTPLVVTVGLSMTIPLSLVAQIFIHGQYSSPLYWIGAAVVFFSFIFVNQESKAKQGSRSG
ncbi:hypothetical protein LOZ53_001225 [Ophidiomyces ophidiicola]|uniref:uncharacterized protein n=1 Tax=Ophidiomyces ophidiicola TaxID=1387563 RepID=UPI0020C3983A|nr:uncharacterized protein LOZ57_004443 [Ophidiomyces ophidiicola]KAI1945145.1 hypothetical protein LOZ57_004443 [Ophidiomyces ophidiicola]KAI1975310.1 hypothetical protein LOZ55_004731 [Ophidiomyces ophidiicola]KAI1995989.1 hypothetical protein LOZ53_001225 [Ophidiomyces ophidiicola]KAI1996204.1 hypothetical protein LOZ54_000287 [Ophidiomyces ophidiicola]KAI2054853.1 hypothetical protein LOZ43_003851 [Ophidiomyces ophidiicola]